MIKGGDTVLANLDSWINQTTDKLHSNMGRAMTEAENQAKSAAPWTDRTGNARNSIFGTVGNDNNPIVGYHGIGVYYGVFLELANQGRYRIVWPTIDWLGGRLLNILAQ